VGEEFCDVVAGRFTTTKEDKCAFGVALIKGDDGTVIQIPVQDMLCCGIPFVELGGVVWCVVLSDLGIAGTKGEIFAQMGVGECRYKLG
jgi:hypothetical protein